MVKPGTPGEPFISPVYPPRAPAVTSIAAHALATILPAKIGHIFDPHDHSPAPSRVISPLVSVQTATTVSSSSLCNVLPLGPAPSPSKDFPPQPPHKKQRADRPQAIAEQLPVRITVSLASSPASSPPPAPAHERSRVRSAIRLRSLRSRLSYVPEDAACGVRPLRISAQPPVVPQMSFPTLEEVVSRYSSEIVFPKNAPMLGHGVSAIVMNATVGGKLVAAKTFKSSCNQKYFENESRILAALGGHPNIVQLYGLSLEKRVLALEFCSMGSLFDLLHGQTQHSTRGSSSRQTSSRYESVVQNRIKIAVGIARGMENLHQHSFAHLDLTSRNILIGEDFEPKICDFGLSQRLQEDGTSTRRLTHAVSYWKAPEVPSRRMASSSGSGKRDRESASLADDSSEASSALGTQSTPLFCPKVDVFAFSIILWEIFHAGQFPWKGDLAPELRVQRGERPPISVDCPAPWCMLITACWQHNPEFRPHSSDIVKWLAENAEALELPGASDPSS